MNYFECYKVVVEFDSVDSKEASRKLDSRENISTKDIKDLVERSHGRQQQTVFIGVLPFVEFNPALAACKAIIFGRGDATYEDLRAWNPIVKSCEHVGEVYTADAEDKVWDNV